MNINTYYEYNNAKTCKYLDSPSNLEDKQNTHDFGPDLQE